MFFLNFLSIINIWYFHLYTEKMLKNRKNIQLYLTSRKINEMIKLFANISIAVHIHNKHARHEE